MRLFQEVLRGYLGLCEVIRGLWGYLSLHEVI